MKKQNEGVVILMKNAMSKIAYGIEKALGRTSSDMTLHKELEIAVQEHIVPVLEKHGYKLSLQEKTIKSNSMKLKDLLFEAETPGEKMEEKNEKNFAKNRLSGAEKIADNAKEKGGDSMLTYHHFNVKLPYYEKASKGQLDLKKVHEEYVSLVAQLAKATGEGSINMSQIEFQKIVGKIEVLGELCIEQGGVKEPKQDKK